LIHLSARRARQGPALRQSNRACPVRQE
jgi:hypothetical protein